MSNKKNRNKSRKLQRAKARVAILPRRDVTVIGQALVFLFGFGIGIHNIKAWKFKKALLTWLGSSQFIKIGSLFVIKKTVALGFVISGLAFLFGLYKKRKSLKPLAESRYTAFTLYPGLFKNKIVLDKSNVRYVVYKRKHRSKYKIKLFISLKNVESPIKVKFSESTNEIDEL